MEVPLVPVACLESGQNVCPQSNGCRTLPLWQKLDKVISGYLAQFTLADLYGKTFCALWNIYLVKFMVNSD